MPCEPRLRIWYDDKNKPVDYKLRCEGKCTNKAGKETDCSEQIVSSGPQGKSETHFCGCDKDMEPKGCQIYYTKDSDAEVTPHCGDCLDKDGNKDPKKKCVFKRANEKSEVPIPDSKGRYRGKLGRIIDWKCDCVAKDDPFEPEDPKNPKKD